MPTKPPPPWKNKAKSSGWTLPFPPGTEVEIMIRAKTGHQSGLIGDDTDEDIFAEMEPHVAHGTGDVDDSREAIYALREGE